jgi:hypothetical protein
MAQETPNVDVGDTVTCETTSVLGDHRSVVRVDRVDEDGVYQETVLGERFVPWEGFEFGNWEVDE